MNTLIYYPTFEVRDSEWVKFALLYLDKLCPIIPEAGDRYLSDAFRRLRDETDLIDVHRPAYEQGLRASLDAEEQVARILAHPESYEPIFGHRDLLSTWRRAENHTSVLFQDKYTESWRCFCCSEGLATQSAEGIHVSRDLADLYMTILAQAIADSMEGASVITEQHRLDAFSSFIRRAQSPSAERVLHTAQSILELKLPANIGHLQVEIVVRHRNRPGFREKQRAFRQALDHFLSDVERGGASEEFLKSLGNTWSDLSSDVLKVGLGAISVGLGVWLALGVPSLDALRLAREGVGAAAFSFGSVVGVRNAWRNTRTNRLARRFLGDLRHLSPADT